MNREFFEKIKDNEITLRSTLDVEWTGVIIEVNDEGIVLFLEDNSKIPFKYDYIEEVII